MRVLVVDQDSSLLTAITESLGEYFAIDAVTTKADCLDLLRANDFDVIVAGERLEDGSGLELLGQLGKHRPNMLRIFAAERERLKLLKGRLGPFGLFRTLSYPIEPRQLLAALSAAGATQDEGDDTPEIQHVVLEEEGFEEPAPAPAPTSRRAAGAPVRAAAPARPAAASERAPPTQARSAPAAERGTAPSARSTAQPGPSARSAPNQQRSAGAAPTQQSRPKTNGATPPSRQAPAPDSQPTRTSRSPARKVRTAQLPHASGSATMGSAATGSAQSASAKSPSLRSNGAQSARRPTPQPGRVGSRMRPASPPPDDSLSDASRLAIEARSRNSRAAANTGPRRSGFLVGAGVVVVIGGLALAFKLFNASEDSDTSSSGIQAIRTPHFSAAVVTLVAETEAAFQQDDYKRARANVQKLQQIAPSHPRLSFFESLLRRRGEAPTIEAAETSRHEDKTPSRATTAAVSTAPSRATSTALSTAASRATSAAASNAQSREQAKPRTVPPVSPALPAPPKARDTAPVAAKSRQVSASNSPGTPSVPTATSPSRASAPRATAAQAPAHSTSASPGAVSHVARTSQATRPGATTSASNSSPSSNSSSPSTFSGKTLEDSNSARPSQQPASIRQAAATPSQPAAAQASTLEPRLVQHVAAEYPLSAADKGTEGLVDLSFVVARDGTVNDVTVVHSEPSDVFNRAAISAVRRWKYEPKTVNGVPVEAHLQLRLQFKLDHRGR